jgi:hypothetical protein
MTLSSRGLPDATPRVNGLLRICARAKDEGMTRPIPVKPTNKRLEIIDQLLRSKLHYRKCIGPDANFIASAFGRSDTDIMLEPTYLRYFDALLLGAFG